MVAALSAVDLRVARGEYVAIMGPSGSGKSTLLNIIGLLDHLSEGSYYLDAQDVTDLSDDELARTRREKIGFVFQFFHLIPRLTAAENIELPLTLSGVPPEARRSRIETALAAFGLSARGQHRPDQLSGGEQQRVAIARAAIMEPALVLADEPTGNLDRASGRDVMNILEALNRRGITLVVVTHDPGLARRADRQIAMVDGHITGDERSRSP